METNELAEILKVIAENTARTAELLERHEQPAPDTRPQDVAEWIHSYHEGKPQFKQLLTPAQWQRYRHTQGHTITELTGRSRRHGKIAIKYNNRRDEYFLVTERTKTTANLPEHFTAERIRNLTAREAEELLPQKTGGSNARDQEFYSHEKQMADADAIADEFRRQENAQRKTNTNTDKE